MADNDKDLFNPIDVSEPRAPLKEMEIIEEALAIRRRDWIKTHMSYIYAAIGVILVGLIVFGISMFFKSTNPMSRLISSSTKNFGTSFDFEMEMTEDGEAVMSYTGSIKVDRNKHKVQSQYEADYGDYTYTGAVYADDKLAKKGTDYENKWTVHDCTDNVQDFFDFDRKFRSGGFSGGAFLRFTGLTSNYSTREFERFVGIIKSRLSTDSSIATITTEKVDGGTRYTYDIDLYEVFEMLKNDGASVFYRATDYDAFVQTYNENKSVVQNAECSFSFVVDSSGYMSLIEAKVVAEGKEYGFSCRMSNFGSAEVNLSEEFLKAAAVTAAQE